jgi:hypothetical protein
LRTERAEDLAEIPLPMHSSAIESATYNTLTGNLEVTFTDGSTASYDVSTNDVIGLVTAESQGAYFNEHIRG